MAYQERLLLFTNEAAVGIFIQEKSSISIALSANGEFIKLFTGKSSTVHLTRFCPTNAHDFARKLLSFRNKYAKQPYLCDRFHKAVSSVFVNSKIMHWKRDRERSYTTSSGWKVYRHPDDQAAYAICPYNKRFCYISEAIYVQDAAVGLHRTSTSIAQHLALTHLTVIPMQSAPLYFQRNQGLSSNSSEPSYSYELDDQECEVPVPISIPIGASDSSSACKFFNEIEHEINILKSISRYPTTLAFALKFEEIDGEIFLCTDPGTFIRHLNSDSQNNFLSESESSLTVETWISKKKETNTSFDNKYENGNGNGYDDYLSSSELDLEDLEGLEHSGFGCNADGPILQLKGDYFTFFSFGMHGPRSVVLPPIVTHISLLDPLNSRKTENDNDVIRSHDNIVSEFGRLNIDDIRGNGSEKKAESNISTPLHVYRNAAIRLLAYREHLLDRERSLRMFRWEPSCLRVITHTSSKNIPRNLFFFDEIQRGSDKGIEKDRERGRDRDGSMTHLHIRPAKLNPPRIIDCPSSSSVKDDMIPLQLTTQSGTRFTAYPVSSLKGTGNINPIENNEIYDDITRSTGNHGSYIPNSSSNYGYLEDEADDIRSESGLNNRKYYKIRGVFTDRTQINLCLHTQIVTALLSNGQDITCTLRECLDPLKGLESSGQGPGNRTFQHQVRTLVSFHVWACQSVEDRDRFQESAHDRQLTVQAAVLRSARHLMIQKIKEKSMGSQSQEVQEHVQDGTQVLQRDRFLDHNYYDKSQSRGEDRTKVRNKDNEGDRGTGRDRDSNQDRGMDIERVLRACKEAVQSNSTSLQFIKDARIY